MESVWVLLYTGLPDQFPNALRYFRPGQVEPPHPYNFRVFVKVDSDSANCVLLPLTF